MKKLSLVFGVVFLSWAVFSDAACTIKGVTFGGAKLYYLPTHSQYDKIVIREDTGDWWLCSEDEAKEMGFRKAPENTIDTDKVITNGDLLDRRAMTMERLFSSVLGISYPYSLTERNIFDQVSSNFYYINNYLWLDVWGTKNRVEKLLLLSRFPPNMAGNSVNQRQIAGILKNAFPEVPDIVDWVFQATQQDTKLTRTSNNKTLKVESIVVVHQFTIFIEFQQRKTP